MLYFTGCQNCLKEITIKIIYVHGNDIYNLEDIIYWGFPETTVLLLL